VTDVDDTEVGKRGTFVFQMIGTSLDGSFEDVEFDRPNRRNYTIKGEMDGSVTWTVEGSTGSSRVRYQSGLDLPSPDILDAITDPISQRLLQRETESTLENLKTPLEEVEARRRNSQRVP